MLESVAALGNTLDTALGTARRANATPASAESFGDMLAQVARGSADTLRAAEASSLQSIRGKASVQQVVDAVMAAEQTLQATIAVRDKVVGAYQELTRMQI